MKSLAVKLDERGYQIHIGEDLLQREDLFSSAIRGHQVMVVTNETVAPLYLSQVVSCLGGYEVKTLVLPDGEKFKTLDTMNRIISALLENRFNRDCTLVALGGGVIGDITGFAAACYQRGVDYIQVPTTVLAQVDSSVGGKTAVNHTLGKNMIGAFHQPRCVIADTRTLTTLDDRQLSAGLAEIVKYGLIRDREFFDWLEQSMRRLLERDPAALMNAVEHSCLNKAEIVAADEREAGERAILNLGHTFGHAIEAGMGYGNWLHGEAVATGMYMAADLSARLGWLESDVVERVERLLVSASLPVSAPAELSVEQMLSYMSVDKKARDGAIRLVLLKDIGKVVVTSEFAESKLVETLTNCRAVSAVA